MGVSAAVNTDQITLNMENLKAATYPNDWYWCGKDPYKSISYSGCGKTELKLYDGRMNHNNGWFVLRSEIPAGATKGAIKWIIEPNAVEEWIYKPVMQTSQVVYTIVMLSLSAAAAIASGVIGIIRTTMLEKYQASLPEESKQPH